MALKHERIGHFFGRRSIHKPYQMLTEQQSRQECLIERRAVGYETLRDNLDGHTDGKKM